MSICYKSDEMYANPVHSPAFDNDVTSLLKSLPALPSLRAARVSAKHRSMGPVDMSCFSHLEHLALECLELTVTAGSWDCTMGPRSFHVMASKPATETVSFKSIASLAILSHLLHFAA